MSQVNNFFPIANAFTAMIAFSRLKEYGMEVNGKSGHDLVFKASPTGCVYHLHADHRDGVPGYRVIVDEKPLDPAGNGAPTFAEELMQMLIDIYEAAHRGQLPFVLMVRDGDDTIKLLLDGSIRIDCSRGKSLVKMVKDNSDAAGVILQTILDSTY